MRYMEWDLQLHIAAMWVATARIMKAGQTLFLTSAQ